MDEEKENDYERKKLNPYANSTSENKYKKKLYTEKSSNFHFYLIIIIIIKTKRIILVSIINLKMNK